VEFSDESADDSCEEIVKRARKVSFLMKENTRMRLSETDQSLIQPYLFEPEGDSDTVSVVALWQFDQSITFVGFVYVYKYICEC
jgi:hypothetical protein